MIKRGERRDPASGTAPASQVGMWVMRLGLLVALAAACGSQKAGPPGGDGDADTGQLTDVGAGDWELNGAEVPSPADLSSDQSASSGDLAEVDVDAQATDLGPPADLATETIEVCTATECCQSDADCDDGNECTADVCGDCACQHSVVNEAGCCETPFDCPGEQGILECLVNQCVDFHCATLLPHNAFEYCCDPSVDTSPEATQNPCLQRTCDAATGRWIESLVSMETQIAEGLQCCTGHLDCSVGGTWEEDGNADGSPGPDDVATEDVCADNHCQHYLPADCPCQLASDCDDNVSCTLEVCNCICEGAPWEFQNGSGCSADEQCDDGNPMTVNVCHYGCCSQVELQTLGCLDQGEDACDDGNPCTEDLCLYGTCSSHHDLTMAGCCVIDADCNDCDDATLMVCEDHQCVAE